MTELRNEMIRDMKVRNFSDSTIRTYIACVGAFAKHFRRSPREMGRKEVREYQAHLVEVVRPAWSTLNTYTCALNFSMG